MMYICLGEYISVRFSNPLHFLVNSKVSSDSYLAAGVKRLSSLKISPAPEWSSSSRGVGAISDVFSY